MLLEVRDLTVTGGSGLNGAAAILVAGSSFTVTAGETLAVVGESGSGKSLTARALVGLLPEGLRGNGTLVLNGGVTSLLGVGAQTSEAWRAMRGSNLTLLLQDPFTSLSPVHRVGRQLRAALRRAGRPTDAAELTRRVSEVGLAPAVLRQYPHELSGGMQQRIAIVLALVADPQVLIADEPTTALDSLTQAEILDLLDQLKEQRGLGVILISHDLEVVRGHAQQILVMRGGEVVETGSACEVLASPSHPYTRALLDAAPTGRVPVPHAGDAGEPHAPDAPENAVVNVTDARCVRGGREVLAGIDLTIRRGEIVGLVGQSGSGKTTLARCIAGLEPLTGGSIEVAGVSAGVSPRGGAIRAGSVQMVFQDPAGTLNPALTVRRTLQEALRGAGNRSERPEALMQLVQLDPALLDRRPATLSGGQRQRVAIARALAARPELLLCDEAVSALDVSVQVQVLRLLRSLRDEHGQTILFISHDLAVVAELCDRIVVLNEGEIVESGDTAQLLEDPQHPYTRRLLEAGLRGTD